MMVWHGTRVSQSSVKHGKNWHKCLKSQYLQRDNAQLCWKVESLEKNVILVKKVINQKQFENSNLIKENNKLIDQLDTIRFEHSYFINENQTLK